MQLQTNLDGMRSKYKSTVEISNIWKELQCLKTHSKTLTLFLVPPLFFTSKRVKVYAIDSVRYDMWFVSQNSDSENASF